MYAGNRGTGFATGAGTAAEGVGGDCTADEEYIDEEFGERGDNGFVTGGDVVDDEVAGDDDVFEEPNKPRISSIVDRSCCCC